MCLRCSTRFRIHIRYGCRILGDEARQFFLRTDLPVDKLSRVWRAVKQAMPAAGEGLTRAQFGAALRVAAVVQVRTPVRSSRPACCGPFLPCWVQVAL